LTGSANNGNGNIAIAATAKADNRAEAPVYGSFSEGFDLPDLKQAKVLLDQLAANSELSPEL
jgi:hypothetical protein